MNIKLNCFVAAAVASVLVSSIALAQTLEGITVQASRALSAKSVLHVSGGIPIVDMSISYGVSTKGLDIASRDGAAALEKRINDAAKAACNEIFKQYPEATPPEAECVKTAADKAMARVHELEAAAAKKPPM